MTAAPNWTRVESVMAEGLREAVFPGAVLLVAGRETVLFHKAFGVLEAGGADVDTSTLYDVSSLTKPLATQACVLALAAEGKIGVDQPVGELLPRFVAGADRRRRDVTIAMLLAHRSGLPARSLYFRRFEDGGADATPIATPQASEAILGWAADEPLVTAPGTFSTYSDVGFMLLGAIVEALRAAPLKQVFERGIGRAMRSAGGGFRDAGRSGSVSDVAEVAVAPTGYCEWRRRTIRGQVQDENAWAMGGVAGHAGLFATADDIHRLTSEYVRGYAGEPALVDSAMVRACWRGPFADGSTWALGWDTPTPGASSGGRRISRRSFGHLGFTGTSVWVDLKRGVHIVLLSNRVHPDLQNVAIRAFRPRLHDAVFEVADAAGLSREERGSAE